MFSLTFVGVISFLLELPDKTPGLIRDDNTLFAYYQLLSKKLRR